MNDPLATYDALRHFADSWGLLAMVLVFLAVLLWAFRPGSHRYYADAARVPFKHDAPAGRRKEQ